MRIQISIGPMMSGYLDDVLNTGMYGRTRSEVARSLLCRAIERLLSKGIIEKRNPLRKGKK